MNLELYGFYSERRTYLKHLLPNENKNSHEGKFDQHYIGQIG